MRGSLQVEESLQFFKNLQPRWRNALLASRDDQNIDEAQFHGAGCPLVSNANEVLYVNDNNVQ